MSFATLLLSLKFRHLNGWFVVLFVLSDGEIDTKSGIEEGGVVGHHDGCWAIIATTVSIVIVVVVIIIVVVIVVA